MLPRNLLLLALTIFLPACTTADEQQEQAQQSPPIQSRKESTTMPTSRPNKVTRTDAEWRQRLTPEQYRVLRQAGTERAFTGELTDTTTPGTYLCAACDAELFHAQHKFHSGCGWPSFYTAAAGDRVTLRTDRTHGMTRTEVLCSTCDSHLGHVFDDAPDQPTGQRYCINSVSLKFVPDEKK
jgi:peptide-methionine (R)-S-oxide reductase